MGAAKTEPERMYARVCQAANMRAWDTLGDCYAEQVEMSDRRALGWDVVRGRTSMVETFQSWSAMSPDMEIRVESLASDDEHIATRFVARGHATPDLGGGAWEVFLVLAASLRDGRIARVEIFDDDAAAVARFEELVGAAHR